MPMDYQSLLKDVTEIVLQAGKLLEAEWALPTGPRRQGDKADIDLEIEIELRAALLNRLDCDYWGEETGSRLSGAEYCWVVDPNDGTADFLDGLKGSALSVGLLYLGIPMLGVVYAPVTDLRGPDCISWALGLSGILRNGHLITHSLQHVRLESASRVLVSAAARKKPELNAMLFAPAQAIPTPSIAYRLATVAAGDAVAGVSLVPTSAHDTVAGHAILLGSGGDLLDAQGRAITYYTHQQLSQTSQRCFGGSRNACMTLVSRDWEMLFNNGGMTN